MPYWTFISNHGAVLVFISQHGQATGREIAAGIGITERSVMRIIADLEAEGYLTRSRDGRGNQYSINPELPLRRSGQLGGLVGELLEALLGNSTATEESDELIEKSA